MVSPSPALPELPDYSTVDGKGLPRIRRFTDPQRQFIESPYRFTLWLGANGIGKSLGEGELAALALQCGLHWQTPGPVTVMLVGKTWAQLGSTIKYMMRQLPKGVLPDHVNFSGGEMKGQRMKVYDIVGGPGAGGELRLCVHNAENIAGPRADVVICDEPLPEHIHNELWPRLFGRNGRMYVAFTVTYKTAAKVDYLYDLVDDPETEWAGLIHTPLTVANCTPRGGLIESPWVTQTEIDQFAKGLSGIEREMRLGLARYPKADQVWFDAFDDRHVVDNIASIIPDQTELGVGIDHGSKPGRQRAVLVAVGGVGITRRAWIIDEYKADGRTEIEDDARGILDMLARNGPQPQGYTIFDVDVWKGDRKHGGDKWGGIKSNKRLQRAIAAALNMDLKRDRYLKKLPDALRYMRTPRKYDGSHLDGAELIHRMMVGNNPRFLIDRRCQYLINDLRSWQGSKTDPAKDGIDAMRYAVVPMVEGERR